MIKQIMLIFSLFLSLQSFSQIDTIVPLKLPVARMVIKDLIKSDGIKLELIESYKVIDLQKDQIKLYKQKDTLKDQKINNLELIISMKDEQLSLEKEKSKDLLKELKAQRRKTFLYRVGTFAGLMVSTIFLLK